MERKRLERFGEVVIVDERNGFGLDFVKKAEKHYNNREQTSNPV